jgi:hypothetical protein
MGQRVLVHRTCVSQCRSPSCVLVRRRSGPSHELVAGSRRLSTLLAVDRCDLGHVFVVDHCGGGALGAGGRRGR